MPPPLPVAPLDQIVHLDRCVDLQMAVWGYRDIDAVPRRIFLLAHHIGGQVFGAFDGDTIVGFAMALPGYRNGRSYLHSHMLAVLPEYRDRGVGRSLKLAQREDALARGFDLMEWTFDPLEIKNAYLNVHRLGCIVRRYAPNFYGPSISPLQGDLPTDRLYAEWWLRSKRVIDCLAGRPQRPSSVTTCIDVPAKVSLWKQVPAQYALARDLQTDNRIALQSAFARGQAVVDYACDPEGNGSFLLSPYPSSPEKENAHDAN